MKFRIGAILCWSREQFDPHHVRSINIWTIIIGITLDYKGHD